MLNSTKAQSALESSILIMLILTVGAVTFPYVRDSWNAHLMSYQEDLEQALEDPMTNAPPGSTPTPKCRCSDMLPQSCGCAPGGYPPGCTSQCPAFHRLITRTCTGADCPQNIEKECREDPMCCNDPTLFCDPSPTVKDYSCCGVNATPPCPNGQALGRQRCGQETWKVACFDNPGCHFSCLPGSTPPAHSTACSGDQFDLPENLDWVIVEDSGRCTTARKCEAYCNPGTKRIGNACFLECSIGYGEIGNCPPVGHCLQDTCGAGHCLQ